MSLAEHAIWWQVYPLGATGAPIRDPGDDTGHRLGRLEPWLDHVVELGCSGLLLGPVFESSSHGYDTLDHFRLDRRLGDDADWDHFVQQCRSRGLSIMLDGVFNHVGAQHPLVQQAVTGGGIVKVRDGRPVGWEGHDSLAELDHDDPRTVDLVVDVMTHWLRRGAAGWRLDVAYAVPAAFWAQVLPRVRAEFPEALFLGEVIHGDYPAIAQTSTLDSITQYELWKAIWSSIQDRNLWELAWALQRHDEFCRVFVPNTFVGNHDVARIASLVGDSGAALAAVILLTVPGMPSIYYGDEEGFRGEKLTGYEADDQIRPPLPDSPADLSGMGAWLLRHYQALVALRRRNPWLVRAHLHVDEKTNTSIIYSVTSDEGRHVRVRLALDPQASAVVEVDNVVEFRWPQ